MSNMIQAPLKEFFSLRNNIEGAFLRLGELLKQIRDEKLYEGQYENFDGFLLEARLSKSTASKMIQVHEHFVLKYKIPQNTLAAVGWATLYEIQKHLPESAKRDDVIEWVEKGAVLTRDDTKRELANIDGRQDKCFHHESFLLRICPGCGFREKVVK